MVVCHAPLGLRVLDPADLAHDGQRQRVEAAAPVDLPDHDLARDDAEVAGVRDALDRRTELAQPGRVDEPAVQVEDARDRPARREAAQQVTVRAVEGEHALLVALDVELVLQVHGGGAAARPRSRR